MDWFGAGISAPLIVIRAIHFGATAVTAGALIFCVIVARPALHSPAIAQLLRRQTLWVAWVSVAIAVASGVVWLLFEAASMSGLPLREATTPGVLLTVLNETQFGSVSKIRTGLAIVLAVGLALNRFAPANWLALAAALGLTAAIAWTGHAGSTPGAIGDLHLAADALHLGAAAGWIGGLVPLALLLAAASRQQEVAWASLAWDAARRFSTLGIVSVATLTATGTLNAWILVGSFHALLVTDYGRLLMLKIAVFAVMLVFAAVNRFWLTPQLAFAPGCAAQLKALGQLTRNSTIEIVLGFIIFAIVGLLGTLHPAIHLM